MKLGIYSKIFLILLVVVSVVGFVAPEQSFAQVSNPSTRNTADGTPATGPTASAKNAAGVSADSTWGPIFETALGKAIAYTIAAILWFWSNILSIGGFFFDRVILDTLVTVSSKFGPNNTGQYGSMVGMIWKIFRDIGNIIIIFSLLYLAIKTILKGDGFADKKVLSGILIAAVLMNFSLLFTKLAFDVSNKVAIAVYEQIKQGDYSNGANVSSFNTFANYISGTNEPSLSSGIMNIINYQGLINNLKSTNNWEGLGKLATQVFMMSVLFGIITVIFIAAGMMLLARFFIFLLLMMTSPIGLVSKFVPWLSGTGKMWWGQLKKQVLALPAFFVAFYIALFAAGTIFQHLSGDSSRVQNVNFAADSSSAFSIVASYLVQFFLLVMFMGLTLFAPSFVGGGGSDLMSKAGQKLKGVGMKWTKRAAGAATLGAGAVVGRATVGALARSRLKGDNLKKLQTQAQQTGLKGVYARKKLAALNYVGNKATYDARNIKVGKNTLGEEIGVGKGIMGYQAAVDEHKKKIEATKKEEFKALGFDKLKADPSAVFKAQGDKSAADNFVKTKETELRNEMIRPGATAESIKAKEIQLNSAIEKQKDMNVVLERLKNKGDSEYEKLNASRAKRWHNRIFSYRGKAGEDVSKEAEKKWALDEDKEHAKRMKAFLATATATAAGTPPTPPAPGTPPSAPPAAPATPPAKKT